MSSVTQTQPRLEQITGVVGQYVRGRHPLAAQVVVEPRVVPPNGFSNITELFDATWDEDGAKRSQTFVIRSQVEGRVLFYESPLLLQWQMMEAMALHSDVPVPELVEVVSGDGLSNASYFVMEGVPGRVPINGTPSYHGAGWVAELALPDRRTLARSAVSALVKIHSLDWQQEFSFLRRPDRGTAGLEQFLAYQEESYTWAAAGRSVPDIERGLRWLADNRPATSAACITWGDARPGNMIFNDDLSVAAVLDWEQAQLGVPEMDVAWWLMFEEMFTVSQGTEPLEGIPDRAELIDLYQSLGGRQLDELHYYDVLAWVRLALCMIRMVCPDGDDFTALEEPFLRRIRELLDA
jgi:aminoglycoside phosphotransferase (APT) family kinase protein